ncbi:MAG: TetR/AcrR family transcriptional regulator [Alphaproteobacteria bacterium]|jgi:AcrR family transcriptional regulator|nr:TetR family transcriptional regulator [Rhodobiaceae bacterium]MBO6543550.1 TetR/AcrR family transcriptional regulator [Alphaproteobacteria bacterium]MBO6627377.1 TetR/AcrR family transcriptional regulator [Alphaproteobacteria bacterium]MDF1626949.1 TetR/AcrR family transcriptional regulator [Parvibaculaceae bacterium]|tara:strand:- start:398 stop:1033 length:636 start_codon:yes stop_codon:yes gene_type:complete
MDLKLVPQDEAKPRLRRDNDRPRQILSAALNLFCDQGYEATRLEDVADAAGVSKATIYLYFENKEDLLFALIRENIVPMVEQTISQMENFTGIPSDFLRMKAQSLGPLLLHSNHGAILKLVVAEARRFPEIAEYFRTEVPERGLTHLAKLIQKGIDTGEFRPCDPHAMAAAFMFPLLMNGIWANSIGPHSIVDGDALITTHMENFLRGLQQ